MPGLVAAVGLIAALAWAGQCTAAQVFLDGSTKLSALLEPGAFTIIGDKRFDGFTFLSSEVNGATAPLPSSITVHPISGPDIGLLFQGGMFVFDAGGNQQIDVRLTFDVTVLNPNQKITANELHVTGGTSGGGVALVGEVLRDAANNALGQELVALRQDLPGGGPSFATASFAPQSFVHVAKDIFLVARGFTTTSPINAAFISDFSQTFHQVPEGSSAVFAGIGAACVATLYRRRRRGVRVAEASA